MPTITDDDPPSGSLAKMSCNRHNQVNQDGNSMDMTLTMAQLGEVPCHALPRKMQCMSGHVIAGGKGDNWFA